MGKYLFFDIDGTLIDFSGKIPRSAIEALKAVRKAGHRIFLCTGRSVCQLQDALKEITFDGMVAASGGYVVCDGEEIFHHYMPVSDVEKVVKQFRDDDTMFSCQMTDRAILEKDNRERFIDLFRRRGTVSEEQIQKVFPESRRVAAVEDYIDRIEKIIYNESIRTVGELRELFGSTIEVTAMSFDNTDAYSGEITTYGINKAYGIQKVLDYYGGTVENTIGFGDGPNDFEMIEFVHTGVVMGNGIDELKAKADYVTTSIMEDGIKHALEHLKLIPHLTEA